MINFGSAQKPHALLDQFTLTWKPTKMQMSSGEFVIMLARSMHVDKIVKKIVELCLKCHQPEMKMNWRWRSKRHHWPCDTLCNPSPFSVSFHLTQLEIFSVSANGKHGRVAESQRRSWGVLCTRKLTPLVCKSVNLLLWHNIFLTILNKKNPLAFSRGQMVVVGDVRINWQKFQLLNFKWKPVFPQTDKSLMQRRLGQCVSQFRTFNEITSNWKWVKTQCVFFLFSFHLNPTWPNGWKSKEKFLKFYFFKIKLSVFVS